MKKLKEKIANNEFLIWLKEKWSNKRNRSWILLCAYFIFFMILGVMIRTAPSSLEDELTNKPDSNIQHNEEQEHDISQVIKNLEILSKYDYHYKLYYDEEVLEGSVTNGTNSFVYQEQEYVFLYDKIYKNNNLNLEAVDYFLDSIIPIEKITISNILESIKDADFEYDYKKENGFQTLYYISGERFIDYPEEEMILQITGVNEIINKIEINYQGNYYILEIIKEG